MQGPSLQPSNTTRTLCVGTALLVLVPLLPAPATAAPSPPPKSIVNTAGMGFGRFVPGAGGSIKVDANGLRTHAGGVILLTSSPAAARFAITGAGNDNRVYILSLPPNGSVALHSGASAMALGDFVSSAPAGGLLPAGAQSISVGATLQVAPGQVPGNYTGAFQVTLEYQ